MIPRYMFSRFFCARGWQVLHLDGPADVEFGPKEEVQGEPPQPEGNAEDECFVSPSFFFFVGVCWGDIFGELIVKTFFLGTIANYHLGFSEPKP